MRGTPTRLLSAEKAMWLRTLIRVHCALHLLIMRSLRRQVRETLIYTAAPTVPQPSATTSITADRVHPKSPYHSLNNVKRNE